MANAILNDKNRNKEELEAMEAAEGAREQQWDHPSFVAQLFMGTARFDMIVPFPEQSAEDRQIGDAYVAKLEAFLERELDGNKIDDEGQIPDSVMKGLAALGAFGMKIPKEYGGLGLSQVNYTRALAITAKYCASTAGMLSAHQSIGVPQPLIVFGTEAQKQKYLPKIAKGAVSAFALTEPDVGSDPARMSTTATPVDGGESYLINGTKLWCTNGAIAEFLVVMAQTPAIVVNGREKKQITAFIVDKAMPGFEVLHRCRFMGLNGIQNALLKFTNVKVPKENIIWGLGKGLKLALVTLNTGRLGLPAAAAGTGPELLRVAREWGNHRKQWGAAIGRHEAGAAKIASLSATQLSLEAVCLLGSAWADAHDRDVRLEAAMAKYFSSVQSDRLVHELLQFRGGRGYETALSLKARGEEAIPVERWARDSRINQIVEGTNEIMRLFIAREALDKHLTVAGDVMNPRAPLGKRLLGLVKAGLFYAWWYPKLWLPLPNRYGVSGMGPLKGDVRYVTRTARRLARTMFHLMLRHGPKLEKRQRQLGRIVDIATELFAMAATIGRARGRMPQASERTNVDVVAHLFCCEARERIDAHFRAIRHNHDRLANQLAGLVLDGKMKWQEERL